MNNLIDQIISCININKNILSNTGTRPLVSAIIQKAQNIVNFASDVSTEEPGLICIVAPSPGMSAQYFKGWKVEDFERLATELENLKT